MFLFLERERDASVFEKTLLYPLCLLALLAATVSKLNLLLYIIDICLRSNCMRCWSTKSESNIIFDWVISMLWLHSPIIRNLESKSINQIKNFSQFFFLQAVCLLMVAVNSFRLVFGQQDLPFTDKVSLISWQSFQFFVYFFLINSSLKGKKTL